MGYILLVLCLASGSGWVSAEEAEEVPTVQFEEESAVHGGGEPARDIQEWLKFVASSVETDDTEVFFDVEKKAENLYAAWIVSEGKTSETHGVLRLNWDQRQVANVQILDVGNNRYYVSAVNGFLELKAPFGKWQRVEDSVPTVYSGLLPSIGSMIGQ